MKKSAFILLLFVLCLPYCIAQKSSFLLRQKNKGSVTSANSTSRIDSITFSSVIDGVDCGEVVVQEIWLADGSVIRSRLTTADSLALGEEPKGAVDLGLKMKWASCNVDASSPDEYGGYYMWADTVDRGDCDFSYPYYDDINDEYIIPSWIICGTKYDVAHVKLGPPWRMFSYDEEVELTNKCVCRRGTYNKTNGNFFTASNGNSIFFPNAGRRDYREMSKKGLSGYYWSGTLRDGMYGEIYAYLLLYYLGGGETTISHARTRYPGFGYSVRPVRCPSAVTSNTSDITWCGATCHGIVRFEKVRPALCGICYSSEEKVPDRSNSCFIDCVIDSAGNFSATLDGLGHDTVYYYRAYIQHRNSFGYGEFEYGEVKSFIRSPSVATSNTSDISSCGATCHGLVLFEDVRPTLCGICYSSEEKVPDRSNSCFIDCVIDSAGNFSATLEGLGHDTVYYYRAYIQHRDSFGHGKIEYGEVKSFTTESMVTPGSCIDLGLSVMWAAWNVGANSPEEYGGYYAWGNTREKNKYNAITYAYYDKNIGNDIGYTNHDAAYVVWGDRWRLPTIDEFRELCGCTCKKTSYKGVKGVKITGPNGNSIFLPAAGYRHNADLKEGGSYCHYWTSTAYDNIYSYEYSDYPYPSKKEFTDRIFGLSVRAVDATLVSTPDASHVFTHQAIFKGTVRLGNEPPISCGICYSPEEKFPTKENSCITECPVETNGTFSVTIDSLVPATHYYYRAYIRFPDIFIYGGVKEFTTDIAYTAGSPVDLGLSVKWADMNVGANSPGEYGDYYAWGETWTKYWYDGNLYYKYYKRGEGYIDIGSNICGTEYDVAHVKWGDKWRMPTGEELKELRDSCTWENIRNGVWGFKITGPNGNSIFLPSSGWIPYYFKDLYWRGVACCYWSGTLTSNSGYSYCISENKYTTQERSLGFSVRPVYNE